MDLPMTGGPDYSGKKGFDVQDLMRKAQVVVTFTAEDGTEYVDDWNDQLIKKKGLNPKYLDKLWADQYVKTEGADFDKVAEVLKVDPIEFAAFLMYKNACIDETLEAPLIPDPHPEMIPDYINGWKGQYLAQLKGEIPEAEEEEEEAEDETEDESAEDDSDL